MSQLVSKVKTIQPPFILVEKCHRLKEMKSHNFFFNKLNDFYNSIYRTCISFTSIRAFILIWVLSPVMTERIKKTRMKPCGWYDNCTWEIWNGLRSVCCRSLVRLLHRWLNGWWWWEKLKSLNRNRTGQARKVFKNKFKQPV